MQSNGSTAHGFRADLQMRIVVDVPTYAEAGGLMDEISAMIDALLRRDKLRAEFDFIGFNTHPCKTARMADAAYGGDSPDQYPALAQH